VSTSVGILFVLTWAALAFAAWFVYHLLRQNGRTLRRVEALEADVEWLARLRESAGGPAAEESSGQALGDRSLAKSRINRNGLPPGTPAPAFTLPRLDGGELSLSDYAGRYVLLVFSDPDCGPCNMLAPRLEKLSKNTPSVKVLMVSRGEADRNRHKVEEFGLTFPVVLQDQWKLSREYAKFATPIGYLIDGEGRIAADVALGTDAILALPSKMTVAAVASRH
jgi:peroxiredoxin